MMSDTWDEVLMMTHQKLILKRALLKSASQLREMIVSAVGKNAEKADVPSGEPDYSNTFV